MRSLGLSRLQYNCICMVIATLVLIPSLCLAYHKFTVPIETTSDLWGKGLTGFWVIVPPVFFWVDWVIFCDGLGDPEREAAKHTHDLSRNIWVAFAGILYFLFFGR